MTQPAPQAPAITIPEVAYGIFTADFDQRSMDQFVQVCGVLAAGGTREVHLLLSSQGGFVATGVTVYNIMRALPLKFVVYNTGDVNSIALIPFLAADERYCAQGSTFTFHGVHFNPPTTRIEQKYLTERLNSISADHERLAGIVAARTKISDPKVVMSLYAQQETKNADWAISQGIAHGLRDPRIPSKEPIFRIPAA